MLDWQIHCSSHSLVRLVWSLDGNDPQRAVEHLKDHPIIADAEAVGMRALGKLERIRLLCIKTHLRYDAFLYLPG